MFIYSIIFLLTLSQIEESKGNIYKYIYIYIKKNYNVLNCAQICQDTEA